MADRPTERRRLDQMTDDDLDALYDRAERAEQQAAHVRAECETWKAKAEEIERDRDRIATEHTEFVLKAGEQIGRAQADTELLRRTVRAECDAIEREQYGQHDEDADGMREAARRIRAALDAAGQLDCPGETDPPTCNCPCEGCMHHCTAHQPDTCRTVDIDGETIRVRGAGDPADTREEASR